MGWKVGSSEETYAIINSIRSRTGSVSRAFIRRIHCKQAEAIELASCLIVLMMAIVMKHLFDDTKLLSFVEGEDEDVV